jgi:octaprenyl-diphosphate synthase
MSAALSLLGKLPGLSSIEALIESRFASDAPLLKEISTYLLSLGGKRIRPMLAILCGQLCGLNAPFEETKEGRQLIDIAAGIELIHMATLLHDDIIDKSPLRRHKASPLVAFGSENTLLAGDFLLTRAFGLCARLDRYVIERTEEACVALTEGEILEVSLAKQAHTLETSLTIAKKKTAALFRLAGETASHIAAAGDLATRHLGDFGEKLGIAFQILDDVLDVTSNEEVLGKKNGQDLRERKPSIVNVLWLASGSPGAARLRTPALQTETATAVELEQEEAWVAASLKELRSGSVIREARELAQRFVAGADEALNSAEAACTKPFEKGPQKVLHALMEYVLERVK